MNDRANQGKYLSDRETILLTRQGVWMSDGVEIEHEATRKLFARSLFHDEQGYWIRLGSESKLIEVEDTAYFVTRLEGSAENGYRLFINDETSEVLDPRTLIYTPGRLTCVIRDGTETARFLSAPYADILGGLEEDTRGYYLNLGGLRVDLESKTEFRAL